MRFLRPLAFATPLLAVLALGACGDSSTAPSAAALRPPAAPVSILNDGTRAGGNPDFFFLPPIVGSPSSHADYDPGKFNGTWKPVVQLCRMGADLTVGCATSWLRTYEGGAVSVSMVDEHYQVNVDTKESWATEATYRARVAVVKEDTVVLGFVDIALLPSQQAVKNLRTEDVVALQDGRTLPLKFRIERGATVTSTSTDYIETTVTNAGAIIRTVDEATGAPGGAIMEFTAGWLGTQASEVVVTVERVNTANDNPCTAQVSNLLQSSDCWRVKTYPDIATVQSTVVIAFCPAIGPSDPRYEAQSMYKYDAGPPASLRELPDTPAPGGFTCTPDVSAAPRQPGLLGTLRYGLASVGRGLSRAFGPNTAYAIDVGVGGRMEPGDEAFSDFFWGIPLRIDIVGGDGQTGAAGSSLTSPVRVRVTGAHVHDDPQDPPIPIPNVLVTFVPAAGSVGVVSALTDANGEAATTWTLGAATGPQSLTASVNSIGHHTTAVFNATAVLNSTLISCTSAAPYGGDFIDRGFFINSYPGTTLEGADLRFSAAYAGTYSIQLIARQGGYGTAGTFLAVDTVDVTLTADINAFVGGSFRWPAVNVQQGAVVAFEMGVVSGPAAQLPYYSVPSNGDQSCGITQTNGTSSLTDVRRQGVWTTIYGTAPVIQ